MAVNRFAELLSQPAAETNPQIPSVPVGFAACPVFILQFQAVQQQNPMQDLYRAAYEQAQAKARMNRLEKRLFSIWN